MRTIFSALSVLMMLAAITPASANDAQVIHRKTHRHAINYREATNNSVAANGRCGGISYGTGARRCGSETGGPSGGLTNRN